MTRKMIHFFFNLCSMKRKPRGILTGKTVMKEGDLINNLVTQLIYMCVLAINRLSSCQKNTRKYWNDLIAIELNFVILIFYFIFITFYWKPTFAFFCRQVYIRLVQTDAMLAKCISKFDIILYNAFIAF